MSGDNWKNLDPVDSNSKKDLPGDIQGEVVAEQPEKKLESDEKKSTEKTKTEEPIESNVVSPDSKAKPNKKAKAKSKAGLSKATKVVTVLFVLGGLAVGGFAIKTRIQNGEQDAKLTSNISTLRADLEKANSELELKVLDLKETLMLSNQKKINDLSLSLSNERELTAQLQSEVSNLKKIITSQNEAANFNEQLLDVLSQDQDRLKVQLKNYEVGLNDLRIQLKSLPKSVGQQSVARRNEIQDVIQVANHKLFNIDLWGSEKLAVFIQGEKIIKVKEGDFFKGHIVEMVDAKNGNVLLNKDDKKFRIQVSE